MITTARMMITSAKLSPSTTASTPLMAAAASRMMIMGSVICWKNRLSRESFFPSASLFRPFFSSRAAASAALSPVSVLPGLAQYALFVGAIEFQAVPSSFRMTQGRPGMG